MTDITIVQEPVTALAAYAQVPMVFTISRILAVRSLNDGLGGIVFEEEAVTPPYEKDYDAYEAPTRWAEQFDLANWGLFAAFVDGERVGGCLVAYDTPGIELLENRNDLTVLWDLRVAPAFRRRGIASRLFTAAVEWSRARHCVAMKIETQNNNVAACHFYAAHGCTLHAITRCAYSEHPEETQLIWLKQIGEPQPSPTNQDKG